VNICEKPTRPRPQLRRYTGRTGQRAGASQRQTPPRRGRALLGALLGTLVLAGSFAGPAAAANLFTLDPGADSMGPVAVDAGGNGYAAWLHKSSPGDTVMFCKFASSARSCAHPIVLGVTLSLASAVTSTPFPVLGPGSIVYVVAPSYDTDQMVMWESTNGGASFGAPWVAGAAIGSGLTYVCQVGTNLDDVLPFNAYGGQYDPSQGLTTLGSGASNIEFEMSSSNPYVNWTFAFYGQGCVVPQEAMPTPGKIPDQYFPFGEGAFGSQEASLGWVSGGPGACPLSALGDEVEAFEGDHVSPPTVRFFHYSAPSGPCSVTGKNLGPSGAGNWTNSGVVTQGAFPRLAGGADGLFMLSGDAVKEGSSQPTAVDVRHYDLASHSFGAPQRLAVVANEDFATGGPAGGLGENYTTGEVAAVWPNVAGDTGQMSLYISTDGGARFSSAQDIAQIQPGYAILDNARVALAANGGGFVTFEDSGGLHVADLTTLAAPYKRLTVHHPSTLELAVTCESPKAPCKASATVKVKGTTIATGHLSVPPGGTSTLLLHLNATGRALLAAAHGHLKAILHLTITDPGASPERLTVHTVIVR
jgi:hypothetical protein